MRRIGLYVFALVACFMLVVSYSDALAAERRPLLQEGKKTLFQRVVTHPGAQLYSEPDVSTAKKAKPVKTFSVFYVYDKRNGLLEVGPATTGSIGWIKAEESTYWPQAMTLLFTQRGSRDPVLFFKTADTIKEICASDTIERQMSELLAAIEKSRKGQQPGAELPVVAAEPPDDEGAVSRKRFYLMPIRNFEDDYGVMKLLEVASIDPGGKAKDQDEESGKRPPRAGIAFVIDTTISMRPYIEQTLTVVKSAFDEIERNKLDDSVGIAVVAFRSSTQASPGIEYRTRVVSDFVTVKERQRIEGALAAVQEAKASTHSFNEDSMAGIKEAADKLNWDAYDGRVIVLITDAGPLPYSDRLALTRMGPGETRSYIMDKNNINVMSLHIKTPAGKANHTYAAEAYSTLSTSNSGTSFYMPIDAPTPKQGAQRYTAVAQQLMSSLVDFVQDTVKPKKKEKAQESPEEEAARLASALGYAMKLDFLGARRDNPAPVVVNAWICDMDLSRLARGEQARNVEVAILLTKNQLSDLQNALKLIVDNAERSKRTDSRDFFQSIISAAAMAGADPQRLSSTPGANLAQTGVLAEFLDGLPYKSSIMTLTEDQWYRYSTGQQQDFIHKIKALIERYEELDKDEENWEGFGSSFAGDKVYRVPLSMLP